MEGIETIRKALVSLREGVELLDSGGGDYYFERLLEYMDYAMQMAPIKKGQRVALNRTLDIKDGGWYGSRHFLVKGSRGIASRVEIYKGIWRADIIFDDESWRDSSGKLHPTEPENRHTYCMWAKDLDVLEHEKSITNEE